MMAVSNGPDGPIANTLQSCKNRLRSKLDAPIEWSSNSAFIVAELPGLRYESNNILIVESQFTLRY